MTTRTAIALSLAVSALLTGCRRDAGQPLEPEQMYSPRHAIPDRVGPIDAPGTLAPPTEVPDVRQGFDRPSIPAEPAPEQTDRVAPPQGRIAPAAPDEAAAVPDADGVTELSNVVREQVRSPYAPGSSAVELTPPNPVSSLATRPTTAGASTGTYMTLGGVVAEVNGSPIYATQVLGAVVGPLRARAQELDEKQFRAAAQDLVSKQTREFIRAELEYAAAQRNLEEKDKQLARAMATQWRTRQITEAGGSLELARRRAEAEGDDFEDLVDRKYREFLTQVFYQRKVIPRIQVTAADMRRYYQQNVQKEFAELDQARFRLIRIDPADYGSRDAAYEKVKQLAERARRGEDFSTLASETNSDKRLMRTGGDVGWIQRGAYANEDVEKAVWTLQPNQVSDIIEAGGSYYLAYLEERKLGRTAGFEEEAVQDAISKSIRAAQFAEMRGRIQENLEKSAIIRIEPNMVNTALEMAMQAYPRWAAAQ